MKRSSHRILMCAAILITGCGEHGVDKVQVPAGRFNLVLPALAESSTGAASSYALEFGSTAAIKYSYGVAYNNVMTATITESHSDLQSYTDKPVYAVTPSSLWVSDISSGAATLNLPSEQSAATAVTTMPLAAVYSSKTGDKTLRFCTLGSVLRIRMKGGLSIKSIAIKSNSLPICGRALLTWNTTAETSLVTMTGGDADRVITLNCNRMLNEASWTEFYVNVPSGSYERGFRIIASDGAGGYRKFATQEKFSLERGKVYDLGEHTYEMMAVAADAVDTQGDAEYFEYVPSGKTYSNPVYSDHTSADPTIIQVGDWFYSYSTGDNVRILRSKNLYEWTLVGSAFTDAGRPAWIKFSGGGKPGIWAPDINYVNGKYYLYYGLHTDVNEGIGVAVSDSPEGPFEDKGALFDNKYMEANAGSVDQFYYEEQGQKYLIWGSYRGIFIIELSDDGLKLKEGAVKTRLAGSNWEGSYLHYRDGYYYLFMSSGFCCSGENSDYHVQVARSEALKGPYLNKKGVNVVNTAGTYRVIEGNDAFVGPGHNGEISKDKNGDEWFIYHSYVKGEANKYGRVLMLDRITWDSEGWPVINDGKGPSSESEAPRF